MKRKVKRTLAFLMTLILTVSLMGKDQLFVAAESAQAAETETVVTEETQQEPSAPEAVSTAEEQAEEEKNLSQEGTDSDEEKNAPTAAPVKDSQTVTTPAEITTESSSEETSSAETSSAEATEEAEESETVESIQVDEESETVETTTEETETEETETVAEETVEEESAEEIEEKPEFAYCETVDGVEVKIHAEEGVLPKDTTVTIKPLDADVLQNAVQSINESLEEKEVVQIIGFDICFFDPEGNELHDLDGKVTVEYSGMDISEDAEEAQVYHADEDGNITHTLTEAAAPSDTVEFTSDQFSPVLYAVLETMQDEVMPLNDYELVTVSVGNTIRLDNPAQCSVGEQWSSDRSDIASVDKGTVRGVNVSEEVVKITHTYCKGSGRRNKHNYVIDTYRVKVLAAGNEGAKVYYLISPTSDPDSNATNQWGAEVTCNGNRAIVNTAGAEWTANKNIFKQNADLSNYIISWPDGSTGATWTLDKEKYPEVYAAVYNTYRNELASEIGVADLELDDIEQITLIPHKISKDNNSDPDKHIDCTISVKCSKAYVARFDVQYPGNDGYTNVSAQNKKIVNDSPEKIEKYEDADGVPPTIIDTDGITYVFDGWYGENGNKIEEWPYTPNASELADGTVNFFARYVRATTNITIRKQVTGSMGDVTKAFSFSYSYGEGSNTQTKTFSLQNGGTYVLENIPIGTTLTLTESNAGGYTISAIYGGTLITGMENNDEMTFTINGEDTEIVVTNNKEAVPDTGVLLDSLPYVLILALVIACGLLFFIRKRRYFD